MVPKKNYAEIKTKWQTCGHSDVGKFASDLVVFCTELQYEQRTTRDPDAMDLSELEWYKAMYENQNPDYHDPSMANMNEEDFQGYCDKVRSDAEAHLDWLGQKGSYKGQGSRGKGGKGGNGGKGYDGKSRQPPAGGKGGPAAGSRTCHWCGKPGHMKKDCRELAEYKRKKDEERKSKGLAPFVPRRGINDLSADDYSGKSEPEYPGMLRSAGSLDIGCVDTLICGECNIDMLGDEYDLNESDYERGDEVVDEEMDEILESAMQEWSEDSSIDVIGVRTPPVRAPAVKSPPSIEVKLEEIKSGESVEAAVRREREELLSRLQRSARATTSASPVDVDARNDEVIDLVKVPEIPNSMKVRENRFRKGNENMKDKGAEDKERIGSGFVTPPGVRQLKNSATQTENHVKEVGMQTDVERDDKVPLKELMNEMGMPIEKIMVNPKHWVLSVGNKKEEMNEAETHEPYDNDDGNKFTSTRLLRGMWEPTTERSPEVFTSLDNDPEVIEFAVGDFKMMEIGTEKTGIEEGEIDGEDIHESEGELKVHDVEQWLIIVMACWLATMLLWFAATKSESTSGDGTLISLDVVEKPGKGSRPVLVMDKGQCRLKRGLTMDSGAHHSVMPRRLVKSKRIRPSAGSKSGLKYVAADKGEIKNEGEVDYKFTTRENKKLSWPFQIAEVNKALVAVGERVDEGYRIIYDKDLDTGEDLSIMIDKRTGEKLKMCRDGNVWVVEAVVEAEDMPESFVRQG